MQFGRYKGAMTAVSLLGLLMLLAGPAIQPAAAAIPFFNQNNNYNNHNYNQGNWFHRGWNNNNRNNNQGSWFQRGLNNGSLTRREASNLSQQRCNINGLKQRFSADGRISPRERNILQNQQTAYHHQLFRDTHNNQNRYHNGL
jgi:hypothetical protein